MKRIVLFLSISMMILSLQDAQSQSLRRLMTKKIIEDNLEAQAKRDSARAVEEGKEPDKSPATNMNQVYMKALGLTGNVDYKKDYGFDAYIQMEITGYKKNGKVDEQMVYDSYLNKDIADYAMVFKDKGNQSVIIFDAENGAMLILTTDDGEKTGMAMAIDPEEIARQAEEYNEEPEENPYGIHKTGRTKKILGYTCDEYMAEDEESEVHIWASEKLGKEVRKEVLTNKQTFGGAFTYAYTLDGMPLEYNILDKSNGEKTIMKVTDIDLNRSKSISTGGYAIMSLKSPPPSEE